VVALVGLATLATTIIFNAANHDDAGLTIAFIGIPAGILAIPYGVSAGYGWDQRSRCRRLDTDPYRGDEDARRRAEDEEQRKKHKQEAEELTRQAAKRAGVEDCEYVVKAEQRVRELDQRVADSVFAHDTAIATCLARTDALVAPCVERRKQALLRAEAIRDLPERGRAMRTLPVCDPVRLLEQQHLEPHREAP
jgi:hypothetical protein